MISLAEVKRRVGAAQGRGFALEVTGGTGWITDAGDAGIEVSIEGWRTRYTWVRMMGAIERLHENHSLSIAEIGGGRDAAGLMNLVALVVADAGVPRRERGDIVLREAKQAPVHQYAEMGGPRRRWPRHRQVVRPFDASGGDPHA